MIPRLVASLLLATATSGCVVAQDLGAERPDTGSTWSIGGSETGGEAGNVLELDPENVMPREQACPLSEPEAWSTCSPTQASAPCVYPIRENVSAICACVFAGDLLDVTGAAAGRWTCVAATVRPLDTNRAGAHCVGSFEAWRTCVGDECALCRGMPSCPIHCQCTGEGKVRCQ